MEVSLSSQLRMLIVSIAVGALMGAFYDLVRVGRMCVGIDVGINLPFSWELPRPWKQKQKHLRLRHAFENVYVAAGDIFFFIVCACVTAVYVYITNNGEMRSFAMVGMVIGFALYRFTVGRGVIALLKMIVELLGFLLSYVAYGIYIPTAFVLCKIFHIIFALFRKILLILSSIYGRIHTMICSYFVYRRVIREIDDGYRRSVHIDH